MNTAIRLPMLSATQARKPVPATSDETLIDSIARGDKRAMELLFARYNVRVYRFIARITGNLSLAEDIVSDVFLDVWRCAGRFKADSQVSTWLMAIARHKALSALKRRTEMPLDEELVARLPDSADDPETKAYHQGRNSILQKCLMQLPPAQREMIDLVYYHEKTIAEAAAITGVPEGTVKTRMLRARGRLAQLLKAWQIESAQAN
jgi:RNA polymerase sigma-70 factor (ECF subfamily)